MARNTRILTHDDLIAAPATAPGAGAIAIVRLSGPGALDAGQRCFSRTLGDAPPRQMLLGSIRHPDSMTPIDQAMAVQWKAPHSYTGEDMVEFHLHGSPAVVEAALAACLYAGARMAEPGEFTRRAFLNGKIDLAQAEAVAALTGSQTEAARRAALAQLRGGLSEQLASVRHALVQVTAELEASVDYPEEDLPDMDRNRLLTRSREARGRLAELLASYERGRHLFKGAAVVFAGAPNAGKSSLFNALLRRERAIVTPHAGTTRDTLEAVVDLRGIPLTLIDTAGLRQQAEEIEALGIRRTREQIETADLILFLVAAGEPMEEPLTEYRRLEGLPHYVVVNKTDRLEDDAARTAIAAQFDQPGRKGCLYVSATERTGMQELEDALAAHFSAEASEGGATATISSARHAEALRASIAALDTAISGMEQGLEPELVVIDLATSLSEIDAITGKGELDEDILDAIFETFCLGK